MIKAVFFDAAGTLFYLPRGVGWHYREVAERHGCRLSEEELRAAFGAVWKAMPPRVATMVPRADDDRGWWQDLVGRVLDRCEVSPEALDRSHFFNELYAEFTRPGIWALFPEVREVLDDLRPRYRLGVISNFDGRLRAILADLGLGDTFSDVVISSEVGADKPDAWIFQQALSRAGVSAREALHVGDDPVCDWQGASAVGLQVFRLDRPRNSLGDLPLPS